MKTNRTLGNVLLVITAIIWGAAFVAQRAGMDYVGPFTFLSARSFLGFMALLPVIFLSDIFKKTTTTRKSHKSTKTLVIGGICCGVALTVASALQQIGMQYSDAGKGGFITAMYILLVPVIGVFLGKKIRPIIWTCVSLGVLGLYLLCIKPWLGFEIGFSTNSGFFFSHWFYPGNGFSFEKGDIYLLLCAVAFSAHILVIDHFSSKTDGVKMSCIQFFVTFLISGIISIMYENPSWQGIFAAWVPICYAGILSSGVGYTLQIIAQKHTEPTVASLIMSLEAVFAVIAGIIILGESPTTREWIGSAVMFLAIIISQLPSRGQR